MNSSAAAESRVSVRRRAANPALAGSSRRRPETAAAAVPRGPAASALARGLAASAPASAEGPEPVPDVPPGVKDADSGRRVLKRKSGEGLLHPIVKKANTVDNSASEVEEGEEYPHRFPDFDWERSDNGDKVTYELNLPRVRIFADCSEDSDDELCRPINRSAPPNAEIERLVEELRVAIKRWVHYFPYDCSHREAVASCCFCSIT